MIQANQLNHNEITAQEYDDRRISDTAEVRNLIKNRAKTKCPSDAAKELNQSRAEWLRDAIQQKLDAKLNKHCTDPH